MPSPAAPAYTGFLIYLLVRGRYDRFVCPACGEEVKRQDTACQACGAVFRLTCAACDYPLQEEWTVCPVCALPFEKERVRLTAPVRRKDRVLWKLLLVLLLTPEGSKKAAVSHESHGKWLLFDRPAFIPPPRIRRMP